MASFPIMLSDFLTRNAQTAAEDTGLSLSAQIEHWAWIGKAVESFLSPGTVAALIRCDGNLDMLADGGEREQIELELAKMRMVLAAF